MKTELASHVGSEFSSRSLVNVSRIRCKLSQPDKIRATSHFYDLLCCGSKLGTHISFEGQRGEKIFQTLQSLFMFSSEFTALKDGMHCFEKLVIH